MEFTKKRSSTSKDKEEATMRWGETPEARGTMTLKPVRLQTQQLDKMKQQRNMFQMKGQNGTPEEQLGKVETGN